MVYKNWVGGHVMRTDLKRDDFISLLEKMKSENDDEILNAVREVNAKMTVAGVTWDDLLISQEAGSTNGSDEKMGEDIDSEVDGASNADFSTLNDEEKQEAEALINAIGKLKISEMTKQELDEYKADLKQGEFQQMDLRYLRAFKNRLVN